MNIASPRLEDLVQRLTRLTGEDAETALERAIEERLSRVVVSAAEERRTALRVFFEQAAHLPVLSERSADEVIGYGPDGLPT